MYEISVGTYHCTNRVTPIMQKVESFVGKPLRFIGLVSTYNNKSLNYSVINLS